MDNMSPADIAAMTRCNDNDGWGGGALWIIILFLFVFMGGGFNGFNRQVDYGQYATAASQQEILFGQQFGRIDDRLTNLGNGISTLGYEMQGNFASLGKEMALAQNGTNTTILQTGNGIQAQLAQCCCDNRLATSNLAAQMDRQTCDITTAIHAEGEATRKLIQENEIQALRSRVASLEMDNRMCGVVRYPNGYTYYAGPSPFCGCNNC